MESENQNRREDDKVVVRVFKATKIFVTGIILGATMTVIIGDAYYHYYYNISKKSVTELESR